MKLFTLLSFLIFFTITSFTVKDNNAGIKDYLAIPGPIQYNKSSYKLSWSAHPTADYYKQEYLPANEKPETFNQMLLVEAVTGNITVRDAVNAKVKELEQRKKTDPSTNYQVIENAATGEYLLDFIVTQSSGDKISIAEWNAYRYVTLKGKSDKGGVMLFAYSKRAYGDGINSFFKMLKTSRTTDIRSLAVFEIPAITFTGR